VYMTTPTGHRDKKPSGEGIPAIPPIRGTSLPSPEEGLGEEDRRFIE